MFSYRPVEQREQYAFHTSVAGGVLKPSGRRQSRELERELSSLQSSLRTAPAGTYGSRRTGSYGESGSRSGVPAGDGYMGQSPRSGLARRRHSELFDPAG